MSQTSTNILTANRQWATRPDDERFGSLDDLHTFCTAQRRVAHEVEYDLATLRVEVADTSEDLRLVSPKGTRARFTNWSFGQTCRRLNAPASYLSTLPADLASQALNHGISRADRSEKAAMLVHHTGINSLRAMTSSKYDRIWNADITARLSHLPRFGWQVPPARPAREGQAGTRKATAADVLAGPRWGLSVKEGDDIAPAGLYASDRDMFAFMVDDSHRIQDGSEHGLARGFFIQNSEVGDSSFKLTTFLYRAVCGNHIIWDASGIREIKIRHIGDANARAWARMEVDLREYANASAAGTEQAIVRAKGCLLGHNKDEVLDALFQKGIAGRDQLAESWAIGDQNAATDGAPDTAWGFAQALTRFSQRVPFAAARTQLDRAAGKVLALAN